MLAVGGETNVFYSDLQIVIERRSGSTHPFIHSFLHSRSLARSERFIVKRAPNRFQTLSVPRRGDVDRSFACRREREREVGKTKMFFSRKTRLLQSSSRNWPILPKAAFRQRGRKMKMVVGLFSNIAEQTHHRRK